MKLIALDNLIMTSYVHNDAQFIAELKISMLSHIPVTFQKLFVKDETIGILWICNLSENIKFLYLLFYPLS